MITPADIQSIEFTKGVRGYSPEEVDQFLDDLTIDYEKVINENEQLKKDLEAANATLDEYKSQEGAVLKTLETAKSLMNDISASAEKRADILMKNAQLDADLKVRQAEDSLERIKEEEANLKRRVASIRSRFKTILEAELERFDDLTEEIFGTDNPQTASAITATQVRGIKLDETGDVPVTEEDLFKTKTMEPVKEEK